MASKLMTTAFVAFLALALGGQFLPNAVAQTTTASNFTFGSVVAPGNGDTTYILQTAGLTFADLDFVDDDGDGTFDSTEPVYLPATAGATVAGNDIRIANTGTFAKGSQVRATNSDFGNVLNGALGGVFDFYDADGDGTFSTGDVMYYDQAGAGAGVVSVNDIVLSGADAGTVVKSNTAGLNNVLFGGAAGTISYFDADGDGTYSANDVVYYDDPNGAGAPNLGLASIQDVIWSGTQYGHVLAPGDVETTGILQTAGLTFADLDFVDDDGDGTFDSGEPVYLPATAGATVAGNDIRIANTGTFAAGTQVRATNSDFGNVLNGALGGVFDFYDADGDGAFSVGDTMYYDQAGAGAGVVSVNDIVLSGAGAGTVVKSNTAGLNNVLFGGAAGTISYFDADGDGTYSASDIVYYDDPNGAGAPNLGLTTIQDVVWSGTQFGHVLSPGDQQTTYILQTAGLTFVDLDFVDDDGDGTFDSGEPVYLPATAGGTVAGNDIRIANTGTFAAGTQVRATNSDFGNVLNGALGGVFDYYDADGDGTFSTGDIFYYDQAGAGAGVVSVNDVILSGAGAGTVVKSNTAGLNNVLFGGAGGAFAYFDADGDGTYSANDIVYYDDPNGAGAPNLGLATIQDVRLAATTLLSTIPQGNNGGVNPPPTTCNAPNTMVNGVCTAPSGGCPTGQEMVSGACQPTCPTGQTRGTNGTCSAGGDNSQLSQLLTQITQLNSQLNTTLTQNTQLQAQISSLNAQLSNQTTTLSAMQQQLAQAQADNKNLQDQLTQKGNPPKTPGFEAVAALGAVGIAVLVLRRKA
ncbi:MAG: FlxA-like family protein [Halobacteriales archaeon]|nr:FlxA-like family protein [Halobacteriales archaeon]